MPNSHGRTSGSEIVYRGKLIIAQDQHSPLVNELWLLTALSALPAIKTQ